MVIVRHGETPYNRIGKLQGHTDVPLNENGRRQAGRAAEGLRKVKFDACYSSDLSRAYETADIVLRGNAHVFEDGIWTCLTLRERGVGVLSGANIQQLKDEAQAMGVPAFQYTPRGGETLAQMARRAELFFEDLCYSIKLRWSLDDKPTILVASHGGLIKDLMTYLVEVKGCTLPLANSAYKGISPNCGFTKITLKLDTEKELESIHCTDLYNGRHLQGLDCLATKNHHLSPLANINKEALASAENSNNSNNSNCNSNKNNIKSKKQHCNNLNMQNLNLNNC